MLDGVPSLKKDRLGHLANARLMHHEPDATAGYFPALRIEVHTLHLCQGVVNRNIYGISVAIICRICVAIGCKLASVSRLGQVLNCSPESGDDVLKRNSPGVFHERTVSKYKGD
jgi:hypothetical protein